MLADALGPGVTTATIFKMNAVNFPNKPALIFRGGRITYKQLLDRMTRLANGLRKLGVRPGDRVVGLLHNSPRCVEVLGAVQMLKAVNVPVSYRLKHEELAYILGNSAPKAVILEGGLAGEAVPAVEAAGLGGKVALVAVDAPAGGLPKGWSEYEALLAASPATDPGVRAKGEDAKIMIYTSGTTGRPKGAVRSLSRRDAQQDFFAGVMETVPLHHDDVHLTPCPLYHSAPWAFMTIYFALGGTTLILEKFEPEEVLRQIEREGVNTCTMVPTMYHHVTALPEEVRRRYDLSSIKALMATGSLLPVHVKDKVIETFGDHCLYDFYGATELGWVTVARPEDIRAHRNCLGRRFPGTEIRLLGEDGREVPIGEVGEIYARNKFTYDGYYGNQEATAATQRAGFTSVGDMAWRDRVGYYFMADRKADMVVSGGVNIYPAEIEQVIASHPAVFEAAVIGVPDPEWGESLRAYVVPAPGAAPDEKTIVDHCAEHLAGYKKPKTVAFVPELPRSPQGKVLKRQLRREFLEANPDLVAAST
ncbi:MAG: AMP-binding protein, partial [Candidatus Methylomirabilis sp.]|nr:AMP-binding protein [Deltaproteobacteria bacterium]